MDQLIRPSFSSFLSIISHHVFYVCLFIITFHYIFFLHTNLHLHTRTFFLFINLFFFSISLSLSLSLSLSPSLSLSLFLSFRFNRYTFTCISTPTYLSFYLIYPTIKGQSHTQPQHISPFDLIFV